MQELNINKWIVAEDAEKIKKTHLLSLKGIWEYVIEVERWLYNTHTPAQAKAFHDLVSDYILSLDFEDARDGLFDFKHLYDLEDKTLATLNDLDYNLKRYASKGLKFWFPDGVAHLIN